MPAIFRPHPRSDPPPAAVSPAAARPAAAGEAAAGEAALVARAARGDAAAFEALMRRYNQRLFRTARAILPGDAEAEDALQEAWLKAWRGLAGFRAEARLSTWLIAITRNEALTRHRRRPAPVIPLEAAMLSPEPATRAALSEAPAKGPEETLARGEMRRLMEARIDSLPEVYRIVFMLRAVEELSVEEVAEALEIPPATVRSRYFRARGLLRESLAAEVEAATGAAFSFDGARCDRLVEGVLARGRAEGLARD